MGTYEREGIGAHAMWGCTPAKDLLQDAPIRGEANILICQPGDIGHVLRTIGTRRQHPQHTINLYVWESQVEVLARHLLLLQVAQDWGLPIRQRANILLEIFGNSFVQDRTSHYISRVGKELVGILFSKDTSAHVVDLSLLKFKHKDQLEASFRSWDHNFPCDMTQLRDNRLRNFFGTRYDHRKNLVDWDYTNRLKRVASIIHHKQYRVWRLDGLAYEFGDQVYDKPNRSMISYAEGMMVKGRHRGTKKEMRGFWLDIRIGPFITFGVDCDRPNANAEELFAVLNKGTGTEQHRHNTAEVAAYSVISYLWGLEACDSYVMTKKNDIYSGLGEDGIKSSTRGGGTSSDLQRERLDSEITKRHPGYGVNQGLTEGAIRESAHDQGSAAGCEERRDSSGGVAKFVHTGDWTRIEASRREQARVRAQCIVDTLDGVKVYMLTGDLSQQLSKPRYHNLFDRVHLGLTAVDMAGSASINKALADQAVITMDTGRYMIPFNEDQQRNFIERTCGLAKDRGWEGMEPADNNSGVPQGDGLSSMDHIGFKFNRKPACA